MAELDDTARYALKLAPAEQIAWLVPMLDADLQWRRWLDTEMLAFPGEPKRRCDTVAELVSQARTGPPWALVLEAEARPRSSMLDRVLEYQARVMRKLWHGPRRRDRYQVAAVVIYLSGKKSKRSLKLKAILPGTDLGMRYKSGVVSLEAESAAATLERIGREELGRSILAWIPLMAGAGDPATVAEWVRLAKLEPDLERQKEYAGLAMVFAGWKGYQPVWQPALEEWNMERIPIVEEWKAGARQEGELRASRKALLRFLRSRFRMEVPDDLKQRIEQTLDQDLLSRWIDAAAEQPSLDGFRGVVEGNGSPPGKSS